jgi:hypothetical protein
MMRALTQRRWAGRAAVVLVAVVAALAGTPAYGSDNADVTHFSISGSFANPCTGETISISGTGVHISKFSADTLHATSVFVWQNVSGVGASGTRYRFVQTGHSMSQSQPPSEGSPGVAISQFMAISEGSVDNFVLRATLRIIFANGRFVVFVETIETECRG